MKTKVIENCGICKNLIRGHSHNSFPFNIDGRSCDLCNEAVIKPIRLHCIRVRHGLPSASNLIHKRIQSYGFELFCVMSDWSGGHK